MYFDIEDELKKLPSKPGVYIMHDKQDNIIYVGKAIILRNRVKQYFQSNNHSLKIQHMVKKINYFEYIVTDTEIEALVLESNLIKEHRPRYNTMLKDDKSYPYIKVTVDEVYPRILFSRRKGKDKDKAKYFGPYTNSKAIKDIIDLMRKLYCIRTCTRNLPRDIGKERPCIYYDIKQCKAPCQAYISPEDYLRDVEGALEFLSGNYEPVTNQLKEKMNKASVDLEFERAAEYRDLLNSVRAISQSQKITKTNEEDRDILALASTGTKAVVQVFFIRDGKLIGRDNFFLTGVEGETRGNLLTSFIKQFYSGTPYIPKELSLGDNIEAEEVKVIEEWLSVKRGQKVYIRFPMKGEKVRLVELARKNASLILQQDEQKIKRQEARTIGAMENLGEILNIPGLNRIESYDISNISGYNSVGSMVVYEQGKPKRNDYRKFRIKSVSGPDDYASLEEVLTRRFLHAKKEEKEFKEKQISNEYGSFSRYPDLILMDGGKGQVNVARKVLDDLDIYIPVCGMVKDDNHRTRGLYYDDKELVLDKSSETFKLVTRIQDETHRFAIDYHRQLRGKAQVHSVLDDIPGVGPKRRKALMKHFESLDDIKNASIDKLEQVPAMNKASAKSVYDFFRQ